MNTEELCRHCGEGRLKSWQELTEEELEVVKRLPGAARFTARERQTTHRWCPRCWHEQPGKPEHA